MPTPNRLCQAITKINRYPNFLRSRWISLMMCRMVPFVGTAWLRVEEMTPERVVVRVPCRRSNRNHIRGVHAAAMTLAAETASGFVVGMSLPDDKLPLIKYLRVEFRRRTRGALRATASLTVEQHERLQKEDRGDMLVPVVVLDDSGQEPIRCEMCWAWVPKTPPLPASPALGEGKG